MFGVLRSKNTNEACTLVITHTSLSSNFRCSSSRHQ
jgi:hypothetical protein